MEETALCFSYPWRTDINLSDALGFALCLTKGVHEETAFNVHKRSTHLFQRLSRQLRPESHLTDK